MRHRTKKGSHPSLTIPPEKKITAATSKQYHPREAIKKFPPTTPAPQSQLPPWFHYRTSYLVPLSSETPTLPCQGMFRGNMVGCRDKCGGPVARNATSGRRAVAMGTGKPHPPLSLALPRIAPGEGEGGVLGSRVRTPRYVMSRLCGSCYPPVHWDSWLVSLDCIIIYTLYNFQTKNTNVKPSFICSNYKSNPIFNSPPKSFVFVNFMEVLCWFLF